MRTFRSCSFARRPLALWFTDPARFGRWVMALLALILSLGVWHPVWAATLTTGDLAFVAFNADEDGWALVTFVDIDPNTIIYFTDNEATSSTALNTGEASFQWNTGATSIPAGSVIRFSAIDAANRAASIGTFTVVDGANLGLSATSETVYAYLGTSATAPTTFLAAVSSEGSTNLTPAGLTNGVNAVVLPNSTDYGEYTGVRSGEASFADYTALVNNSANWFSVITNDNSAVVPDTTAFTIAGSGGGDLVINEFVFNHVGSDTYEYVEIFGAPNTDYSDLSLLQIEGDGGSAGTIDSVTPLGTTDANGFWTTGFLNNVFENGTITLLLAEGFTSTAGSDLDTNDDGTLDTTPWTTLVDGVAVTDGGSSDRSYATSVLGPNYDGISPVPGGASRIPNGTDTDTVSDWVRNDFDLAGIPSFTGTLVAGEALNTPGTVNTTTSVTTDTTIDLSTYVRIGRYNLPVPSRTTAPAGSQLALEVSTVTYNPATDTLFVLGDEGTSVVQVSKNGQFIDSMTLSAGDFDDPEGLTHVSGSQFVLIEERERQVNRFTYVPGGTLSRADVQSVKLGTTVGNIGLEGISFDPQTGGFILVKETSPQGIFQTAIDFVAGTATNGSPTTENSINLFDPALAGLTDIADVYALSNLPAPLTDDNLLVLSQEDGKIINIDRAGTIANSLTITTDPDNPLSVAGQGHEGVSMDNDGLLYVVNEQGGGDGDHPQLWVYAPATYVYANAAPVEVSLSNVTTSLPENSSTATPIQVGTIIISDDALGTNTLSLSGADAAVFEIVGTGLFIKAGTALDFETKTSYTVTVNVDDASVGSVPDASTTFTVDITDTTDTPAPLIVSEVAPWSSGNSPGVAADWFEVTNVSASTIDITGWKMDDSSASFSNAVALNGVTSIAPGQSAIFVEGNATTITAFVNTWFGGTLPTGVLIGTYSGSGVGLGTSGDAVNLFNAGGTLVTGVTFGASPSASPFATFDNAAGNASVSTLSVVGVNGAFSVLDGGVTLIGSPGTISGPVITKISAIQGSGSAVTSAGPFTVEAIVVGDYQEQGSGRLRGFFLQEEDADSDGAPATSEGIFVFCSGCPTPVAVGDKVRVTGAASEFFGMSQLTATTADSVTVLSANNALPTPATVQLPVPGVPSGDLTAATAAINAYFEPFEGMLVTFPSTLAISEYFELARYGQVILSANGRPRQFTDQNAPSVSGYINHEIDLASRTIILDDTDNRQNRPIDNPNTNYYYPVPGLSISNFFRGGDTITNLTGVLHWSFAGQTGTDAWRIRPVVEQYSYAFTSANARPAVPSVDGALKVASFNVLNYFLTIDTTSSSTTGACGASATLDCRGPDSTAEREQQQAKLTAALNGLNADVLGLIELENTPGVDPLAEIVADLNAVAGAGTYAAINTGVIGTDAIKVGLIYKPAAVTPIGQPFIDTNPVHNRPPVAQLFATANGGRFTVVVNHFKSKSCTDATGANFDQGDGQGCYNAQRVQQAQALLSFIDTITTQTGDPDLLIIGDLNAYAQEDPITTLTSAGYTNLVAQFGGPDAYSYVFDGQLGYLDHALASTSLVPQVSGTAEWHINADEIPLFDYNDTVRDTGESSFEEESDTLPLYEPNAFRTSDHDPVIVGLNLEASTGNLTIIKEATPAAAWLDWNFTGSGSIGDFTLDNDDQDETHADRQTFEVVAGTYSITETNKLGNWDLEITCDTDYTVTGTAVTVAVGVDANVTCTFANKRRPQIQITKYHDLNRNGLRDDGEPGVEGWQMFLYIADGNGWKQIQTRVVRTNSSGQAGYTNLEPGVDHLVCEEARADWLPTAPGANAVAHDGKVCQIVSGLEYGEVREVIFGNYEATLGCTLLDDFNRPDQSILDGSWQGELSGYFIENGEIIVRNGGAIFWNGTTSTFGADQSACITLAGNLNDLSGLALKAQQLSYSAPFIFVMYNADREEIQVITNAAITWRYKTVATFAASLQAGDQLGARAMADGTVLIYVNGAIVGTVTPEDAGAEDLAFFVNKGGRISLWNSDGSYTSLDDFGAATIE